MKKIDKLLSAVTHKGGPTIRYQKCPGIFKVMDAAEAELLYCLYALSPASHDIPESEWPSIVAQLRELHDMGRLTGQLLHIADQLMEDAR